MADRDPAQLVVTVEDAQNGSDLTELLAAPIEGLLQRGTERIVGSVIGTLVGFATTGATPLVIYPEQPGTAALPARTAVEVQGRDVGRRAVLTFDEGDPYRPIILGCLVEETTPRLPVTAEHVEVDADRTSLVISAKERIVLRCGKSSITLTNDGKLILQGEYVSNQSAGVLRLKGGSVQIN